MPFFKSLMIIDTTRKGNITLLKTKRVHNFTKTSKLLFPQGNYAMQVHCLFKPGQVPWEKAVTFLITRCVTFVV